MQKPHGFSLIELAVVMTVMAILSTAALPSVIATARGKYGERLVQDINDLREAAEAYYHQNANQWPGLSEEQCAMNPSLNGIEVLENDGFLTSKPRDPFSNEHYTLSYKRVEENCHLYIHTPRNAKLSANLSKLNAILRLAGEPQCEAEGDLLACSFAFAEPKLGVNFDSQVAEKVDPIETAIFPNGTDEDNIFVPINSRINEIEDFIFPDELKGESRFAPINTSIDELETSIDELENFIFPNRDGSDADNSVATLQEAIAHAVPQNATPTGPERYVVTFWGQYGYCGEGYTVEQCNRVSAADFCTASSQSARCQASNSAWSGIQRCTMTCVR